MSNNKQYTKDVQELVVQRLLVLPSDRRVVIGGHGDFTKEQLIEPSFRRRDHLKKLDLGFSLR